MSDPNDWWKERLVPRWAEISGRNPHGFPSVKFRRIVFFVLILVVFFFNIDHWNRAGAEGTNGTIKAKLHLPSPSVLFYGQRDEWEDEFVYLLLAFLLVLSAFYALCFDCWQLFVPAALVFKVGLFVFPRMALSAVAKLVHEWNSPDEHVNLAQRVGELLWTISYSCLCMATMVPMFERVPAEQTNGDAADGRLLNARE
ncbi:hypothetical protein M3Y99_00909900 [Aphelenchoides fujianensis]|nr:hypothetical protein M3Y99_00909900 [Aphelenchoides fujianensis]